MASHKFLMTKWGTLLFAALKKDDPNGVYILDTRADDARWYNSALKVPFGARVFSVLNRTSEHHQLLCPKCKHHWDHFFLVRLVLPWRTTC